MKLNIPHTREHVITELDTVITPDNVQEMGEMIAVSTLKHLMPYRKVEDLYYSLIRDIHRKHDIKRNLSDGYDYVQTAVCFLCEHMGKKLGDKVMGKYKKPVTIRHACYSELGNMVYKLYQTQINTVGEHRNDTVKVPKPFEEDTTEQSHKRAEQIIRKMKLTKKQKKTLDCYLKGMGICEISRLLGVVTSTVYHSRMIIQRKYNEVFGRT